MIPIFLAGGKPRRITPLEKLSKRKRRRLAKRGIARLRKLGKSFDQLPPETLRAYARAGAAALHAAGKGIRSKPAEERRALAALAGKASQRSPRRHVLTAEDRARGTQKRLEKLRAKKLEGAGK